MSDLARKAYEYNQSKLPDIKCVPFERLTVAELSRRHEQELRESIPEIKTVTLSKLKLPIDVLTNGDMLGKTLGEATNKLFAFGRSLKQYAIAASQSYVSTVTVKQNTPLTEDQVVCQSIAERMLNKESFTAQLPTGETMIVDHGEIKEMTR